MLKGVQRPAWAVVGAALGTYSGLAALDRGQPIYGSLILIGAGLAWVFAAMLAYGAWEERGR